jgi:hypothetical protein
VINIVERSDAQAWDDFEGQVVDVKYEEPKEDKYQPQWHFLIKPLNREMKKEDSFMHEWYRIPQTTAVDGSSVPRGSVIERLIESLEDIHGKVVKDMKTVKEVLMFTKGKKYLFKRKILGKAMGKTPASEYWIMVKLL